MDTELARRPLVVAHRGASGTSPENTIASFSEAIAQGADAIELDVRLSKDEHPVVIHDATLRRTASGRGYVRDRTIDELKMLDAGSWFHRSFSRERIPTLAEVLRVVNGRVGVNIEIKAVRGARASQKTVERCLQVLDSFRPAPYVLVSSFQHSLLALVRRQNPDLAIGIIYDPFLHRGRSPITIARNLGARVIVSALRVFRRRWVAEAHQFGIATAVYTINNEKQLRHCLQLGVSGVLTNYPEKLVDYLKNQ